MHGHLGQKCKEARFAKIRWKIAGCYRRQLTFTMFTLPNTKRYKKLRQRHYLTRIPQLSRPTEKFARQFQMSGDMQIHRISVAERNCDILFVFHCNSVSMSGH